MTLHRLVSSATLAALLLGGAATLGAQAPEAPAAPASPAAPSAARQPREARPPAPEALPIPPVPPEPAPDPDRNNDDDDDDDDGTNTGQDIVRVGQDFTQAAGEEARDVVVIMGNAVIDGRVRDLVVVMGTVRLGPAAVVDRTLTSVAGGVTVAEGATVGREIVVVGGALDAPPTFKPGRDHVVINPPFLGTRLNAIVPYFTRGLMWGRVIVPGLGWLWAIVGVFFIVYLVVNLLADGPVRVAAGVLDEKALTAFGTGLLAILLLGPVSFLLAVSVVGILVIPVLLCALLAAALVGKVATFRWLGMRIWRSDEPSPIQATVTFVIGFAVVTLIYMVPVIGVVAFALLSVLGLGAACLAFVAAYRKEQPPPVPVVPPPMPPPTFGGGPHAAGVAYAQPNAGSQDPAYMSQYTGSTDPAYVPPIAGSDAPAFVPPPPMGAAGAYAVSMLPRAAFRDRLAAFVLDLILVMLLASVMPWPFRGERIVFFAMLVYHIGFWAWKHTTVGGIICQLRIVRVDGVELTPADAIIRGLSAIFSVVVLGLGFFWVLRDPERQSWHDKIAGTYVVKVPRNWRNVVRRPGL